MAPPGPGGTRDTALFTCSTVPWKCGVTLGMYVGQTHLGLTLHLEGSIAYAIGR